MMNDYMDKHLLAPLDIYSSFHFAKLLYTVFIVYREQDNKNEIEKLEELWELVFGTVSDKDKNGLPSVEMMSKIISEISKLV